MHNGWIASRAPAAEFKVIDTHGYVSKTGTTQTIGLLIITKDRLKMTKICGSPSL